MHNILELQYMINLRKFASELNSFYFRSVAVLIGVKNFLPRVYQMKMLGLLELLQRI